jgi:protein-L-isoaspartate(D-aspartate) O-methyltransferase
MSGGDELAAALAPHVADARVLEAIRTVPRDRFVPAAERARAWDNEALPLAEAQTISQPLVVARMCELLELRGDERVLDVGTGSGYHAAVLAQLAGHVWSIEIREGLAARARQALAGVEKLTLVIGDGLAGWPDAAPFDAISVTAAGGPDQFRTLLGQMSEGGRLVAPIDEEGGQRLAVLHKTAGRVQRTDFEQVRFVPLTH